jgi:hypothetical protein
MRVSLLLLVAVVVACAICGYRHSNAGDRLSDEYSHIARSLRAGEGFAHPFGAPTGPTAWQPPVLPSLLAGILWACEDQHARAEAVLACLQACVLLGTGFLVLALGLSTARSGPIVTTVLIVGTFLCHFRQCFQFAHDGWLLLLLIDCLIVGLCWSRPFARRWSSAVWGLFGGLAALTSPVAGLTWGVTSAWTAHRQRVPFRAALALLVAALTVLPWTIRNYLVLGRWLPLKSNLAYELFQSHCLQTEAVLQRATFRLHPGRAVTPEGREFRRLGEVAYMDVKWRQFSDALRSEPNDFLHRTLGRFVVATVWYEPFHVDVERSAPWVIWTSRLAHPLPFLGALLLLRRSVRQPLRHEQWIVIGIYVVYLLPYVFISYYPRYAMPLLGVKMLLILWAIDELQLATRFFYRVLRSRLAACGSPSAN